MKTRRMALACVLMVAVVIGVLWVILESPVVASLSTDTSSGRRVTCAVHAEKGGYSIRTGKHGSLWYTGGSNIVRIDSDAPPQDVAIEYDTAAERFLVRLGKQRIYVDVNSDPRARPVE